ncbi:E3 ubiquitin-protein ligase TRIM45-like [Tubulanus polymorphus]|uniref:E3 ubiquitin-protein ligase TRIM45-like n=1 Tax=Tubulanus polymorphus TaxID=672921 RepID=UPI003DA1D638
MSDRISKAAEEELHCDLCGRIFDDPRLLPCLHSFCAECISKVDPFEIKHGSDGEDKRIRHESSDSSSSRESGDSSRGDLDGSSVEDIEYGTPSVVCNVVDILCPVCDTEVQVPKQVEHLPVNHLAKNKIALLDLLEKNDTAGSIVYCSLCTYAQEAVAFCAVCEENMCSVCTEAHKRQRLTCNHTIVTIDEDSTTSTFPAMAKKVLFCRKHASEALNLFCCTCQKLVCRDCVLVTHRDHNYDFISECADEQRSIVRSLGEKLDPVKSRLQGALNTVQNVRELVLAKAEEMEDKINEFMDSYVTAIEEYRNRLLDKLDAICREKVKSLKLQKICLQQNLSDLCHCHRFTKQLVAESSDVEVLNTKNLVASRLLTVIKQDYPVKPVTCEFLEFDCKAKGDTIDGYKMYDLQTCREDQTCQITLITVDQKGDKIVHHSSVVKTTLDSKENKNKTIPLIRSFDEHGLLTLTFTPQCQGRFVLNVTVDGQHIKDSPYSVNIKPKRRRHTGIYQCCTFCSTSGRRDVACGCGGTMLGGFRGCGHGHTGHPGKKHWSCCGKLAHNSECSKPYHGTVQQITL